jgi:hypothetical protein
MVSTLYRVSDGPRSFVSEYLNIAAMDISYLGQLVNISENEANKIVEN